MKIVKVKEFSKYPGPRYAALGDSSGEVFRDTVLIPALAENDSVGVDFDGVYGYGSSFLEEAFGGLVRKGIATNKIIALRDNLIASDDTIKNEVISYINDALTVRGGA
ncbi:Uncharacterised protein [Serratia fonticola]|uniref:STAS-like domain-containing protein n=1 Tax=Serratia fonticola TaxID=47917 RepID=UPI00217A8796|nr:STAS-like domain-containing protein [Serratia fonticola]CAI2036205.1 Uncharacterised protein [Serratia fonticola]